MPCTDVVGGKLSQPSYIPEQYPLMLQILDPQQSRLEVHSAPDERQADEDDPDAPTASSAAARRRNVGKS